jgi:hypothetical protein
MISEAHEYLSVKNIKRREPLYSATRAASVIGDIPIGMLQSTHLENVRKSLQQKNLSVRTIESTVSDLLTLHRHFTGTQLASGRRLAMTPLNPVGVDHKLIDLIWPECKPWVQSWIALTMWTGLRLSDSLHVLLRYRLQAWPETLSVIASKTGKHHAIPLPAWLRKIVTAGPYRFRAVSDFSRRQLRYELFTVCDSMSVPRLKPKYFRQEGITQWTIANASAGAVIHGCGLKVLGHYVSQATLLSRVSMSVSMPECFGASSSSPEKLLDVFKLLDPEAQQILTATASRLIRSAN